MKSIRLIVKLNSNKFNDEQISGYCTDLSVAIKRLGLEVKDIKESAFSWRGQFSNPYECDKKIIREYLDNVNKDLFKIQVHEVV